MEDLSKLSKKELIERLQNAGNTVIQDRVEDNSYENELRKVERLSDIANPHKVPFQETSDHKNIMLYTALNKKVGPLHPENARRTMIRWRNAGIQLYTNPRTPEQVEAFKQTEEYKIAKAKHDATRKLRRSQSSKGKTEQMMTEIARVTAQAVAGAKNDR